MARDADQVLAGMLALLPPGWAVPHAPDSNLARLLRPFAARLAAVEASADALRAEVDPRVADALLPDYERVLGPDPCDPAGPTTLSERRRVAHQRWTQRGDPSRAFFVALAASRGVEISIEEGVPSEAGAMQAGDELVPTQERFVWGVRLLTERVIEPEAGALEAGMPLGEIVEVGVECPIRRFAPAHTLPVFIYEEP